MIAGRSGRVRNVPLDCVECLRTYIERYITTIGIDGCGEVVQISCISAVIWRWSQSKYSRLLDLRCHLNCRCRPDVALNQFGSFVESAEGRSGRVLTFPRQFLTTFNLGVSGAFLLISAINWLRLLQNNDIIELQKSYRANYKSFQLQIIFYRNVSLFP